MSEKKCGEMFNKVKGKTCVDEIREFIRGQTFDRHKLPPNLGRAKCVWVIFEKKDIASGYKRL